MTRTQRAKLTPGDTIYIVLSHEGIQQAILQNFERYYLHVEIVGTRERYWTTFSHAHLTYRAAQGDLRRQLKSRRERLTGIMQSIQQQLCQLETAELTLNDDLH